MSRIRRFYERRFEQLLSRSLSTSFNDVSQCFDEASRLSKAEGLAPSMGLALFHADLRRSLGDTKKFPQRFFCDVGLGGLTRWLRGAGYEAHWKPGLDDASVIRETERLKATLITTDSLMTERGVLRDELLPWVWIPSSLTCEEHLTIVLRELELPLKESRCMHCGGALRRVAKADVSNRIPPRTALWLDEYFLCTECDQLFWQGTHWKRINSELKRLAFQSSVVT